MNKKDFISFILDILNDNKCDNGEYKGFKTKICEQQIISISNTTEALLILDGLFGKNFMFNSKVLDNFNADFFDGIKKYLLNKKDEFLRKEWETNPDIEPPKILHIAYCGLGLYLSDLKAEADKIKELILSYSLNEELAWGIGVKSTIPDTYSTFICSQFLNRIHFSFKGKTLPTFLSNFLKNKNLKSGIPFDNSSNEPYIEAVILLWYMIKFYYRQEEMLKTFNKCMNSITKYYNENFINIKNGLNGTIKNHPVIAHTIWGFGLASFVIENPDYYRSDESVLLDFSASNKREILDSGKSLPLALEFVRLYNSLINSYDPITNIGFVYTQKANITTNRSRVSEEYTIKVAKLTAFLTTFYLLLAFIGFWCGANFLSLIYDGDYFQRFGLFTGILGSGGAIALIKLINRIFNNKFFNYLNSDLKNKKGGK